MTCNHDLDLSITYMSDPPKYKCKLCGKFCTEISSSQQTDKTEEYKEFWKMCAASAIAGGCSSNGAANMADSMLIKYKNKKF